MFKLNFFKKVVIFFLLYTILLSNSSIFYIYGEEISSETESVVENNSNDVENVEQNQQDPLSLIANSAVLIDAKTGIVLYDKNMNEKVFPASTTKILTTLVALENTKPTDILKFSYNAVYNIGPGSSNMGMKENEELTMKDALYGVMLKSANEVCMAIAEFISKDVDTFMKLLNKRAKEIGAVNTNFKNPHGYHNNDHYTTSYDMALIMQEAIKNEEFVKIISTKKYTVSQTNLSKEKILTNSNKLILENSPFYYENCVGGKTGFTNEAGNTLVSYAKKDGIDLIAVIMKGDKTTVYEDTKKLFEYGFTLFGEREIFAKSDYSTSADVFQKFKDQKIPVGKITVVPKTGISMKLPNSLNLNEIKTNANLNKDIYAPLKIADTVGEIELLYKNQILATVHLISNDVIETIPEKKLQRKEKFQKLTKTILKILKYTSLGIIIFFILMFILATITRNIVKYKRRKYKKYKRRKYTNYKKKKRK